MYPSTQVVKLAQPQLTQAGEAAAGSSNGGSRNDCTWQHCQAHSYASPTVQCMTLLVSAGSDDDPARANAGSGSGRQSLIGPGGNSGKGMRGGGIGSGRFAKGSKQAAPAQDDDNASSVMSGQ